MHDDRFDTYLPWFILREIPFLGNVTIKKLIEKFDTPTGIFSASDEQLKSVKRIGYKTIEYIRSRRQYENRAAKELEKVLRNDFRIVALNEDRYPLLLKNVPDPPPVLTYIGTLDNQSPCISIVGSRHATSYGLSTARHLASNLAQKGFQIVSGLARGIDSMAHEGAVSAGKRTIAILGSGLKQIYPRENKKLFLKIAESGTIFSEFKIDAPPAAAHFPVRNRIIAGLSCGTVVVEAAKRSGSLITARLANEYNREVFAVPGSIKSKKSEGTHALLKNGACLVESDLDIIDELHQFIHVQPRMPHKQKSENSNSAPKAVDKADRDLLSLIEPYPVHIDMLVEKSKMECSIVTAKLLELELAGRIIRHPGNFYSTSEGNHCQNRSLL